jgi:hypothetical protein
LYALLDRGFAWIHLPGVPLFAGEAMVFMALLAIGASTPHARRGVGRSVPVWLLLMFMAWGLARTIPLVPSYPLDSIRDASLWYYAVIAVACLTLVSARPDLPVEWARLFSKAIPWLLVWLVFAILLGDKEAPVVPASNVPIFSHKPGNVAVMTVIIIGFLWLVPLDRKPRHRIGLTALAIMVVGLSATKNRGGLVASVAALAVAWLLCRERSRLTVCIIATIMLAATFGWALNARVASNDREISVAQLAKNIRSVTGGGDAQLESTAEWRAQLWSRLLKESRATGRVMTGWGFGPNIALELGFAGADDSLRSPHNSHLGVYARMGLIGSFLWGALWLTWYVEMVRGRHRLLGLQHQVARGLVDAILVGVTAILVNAYFDPTLESPPVALWLWTMFGLGLALTHPRAPGDGAPVASRLTVRRGA